MKKLTQLAAAVALTAGAISATPVMAAEPSFSANAGFVSDYVFRGVQLGDAGAYGGLDAELGGFYAGTWIIEDNNGDNGGLETDFYAGYGFEFENGVSVGLGYNRYEYTYTPDYEDEMVLSLGFAGFGVDYIDGTANYDVDSDYKGYVFSWGGDIFGFAYGRMESDEKGDKSKYDWVEVSASGEVVGLDVTATLGKNRGEQDDTGADLKSGDGYFVVDVSKSFDL